MKEVPNILWLEEIRKEDISSVGGKGASLGEMASIGLPVPTAFVVTAQAFRRFLVETGLEKKLFAAYNNLDVENNEALEKAADTAKASVLKAKMPVKIRDEIRAAYKKMDNGSMIVAVLDGLKQGDNKARDAEESVKAEALALCGRFPIYAGGEA